MATRHKILLLDDDPELLDTYQHLLSSLPSQPEVVTANSGSRAMAMLEDDSYRLLICDLKMPKMDGLQVLSIVRRKYPQLRTVVLTCLQDEQYRSRAYALGVDLFWHKPSTEQEIKMLLECLESLLGREAEVGFRGVQSKSLMDIIQLECISQSSAVLRITNGPLSGKIWIQDGEVIDSEAAELTGEAAFRKILSWKTGGFESLPPEPTRARTIDKSYNALLLETAQAFDEATNSAEPGQAGPAQEGPLGQIATLEGIEFVLAIPAEGAPLARGLENPEKMSSWARETMGRFAGLGERLQAGPLEQVEVLGPQRHVTLTKHGETRFCLGWKYTMSLEQIRELTRKAVVAWAS